MKNYPFLKTDPEPERGAGIILPEVIKRDKPVEISPVQPGHRGDRLDDRARCLNVCNRVREFVHALDCTPTP